MATVKVKGRTLSDSLDGMRARQGDAAVAALIATLDPAVRDALRGAIIVSDWYPLEVLTTLLEADVKMHDRGNASVLVARTEAVVDRQLRGVYRIFIRLGSPEWVVKRIAAIHENYFDGVRIEPQLLEGNRAVIRYTGFEPRHAIVQHAIVGFYRKALEISGAKHVETQFTVAIGAGDRPAELQVSWR